jgi:RNase P subunit RPR2
MTTKNTKTLTIQEKVCKHVDIRLDIGIKKFWCANCDKVWDMDNCGFQQVKELTEKLVREEYEKTLTI